jgi:hypothetical protein
MEAHGALRQSQGGHHFAHANWLIGISQQVDYAYAMGVSQSLESLCYRARCIL